MRVTGGVARGRRLVAPRGRTVRPTSDYLREALFNSLGEKILKAQFLDLYAGTGAVGIDALSRGATHATFVESAPVALAALRRNIDTVGCDLQASIITGEVFRFLDRPSSRLSSWDLIFADPPYRARAGEKLLRLLSKKNFLHPNGFVIIESFRKDEPALPPGWGVARRIAHGDTVLVFYGQETP